MTAETAAFELEIAVKGLATDLRFGLDGSRYVGTGTDYVQSRPFEPGDQVRDVDWRVSARARGLHVKVYQSLKTVPIYLLVDTSASMAFQSGPVSKQQLSFTVAGALALAAIERLSPVGLVGCGDRPLRSPPSLNRARVFQWLRESSALRWDEGTQLAARIELLSGALRSRHLVMVLSDLHQPQAVDAIRRLAQRHDTIVLRIEDPAERGRLGGGFIRGVEAETGREFTAHGWSRWFGRRPAEEPEALLRKSAIDFLRLATDRPVAAPLRQFLIQRGGLARSPR